MTVSWWQVEDHWVERRSADVLVIGAGMAGAGVAWWLGRAGLKVAVVDRGDPASGASGRNAGFLTGGSVAQFGRWQDAFGAEMGWQLIEGTRENRRLLWSEVLSAEPSCRFAQRGAITVAATAEEAQAHAAIAGPLRARGLPLSPIDQTELERMGVRGFISGWHYAEDATVQPVRMVRAILARSGARVWPHTEVIRLSCRPEGVQAVTSRGRISARLAVLAVNGVGRGLHPWLDAAIQPTRGQALVTHRYHAGASPAVYAVGQMAYFRPTVDGRLVLGGCRKVAEVEENTSVDSLNSRVQLALDDVLKAHIPAAGNAGVSLRWSGIMGYTPDNLPLVGPVPGEESLYVSAGFCGHGTGWTFRCAKLLSEHILRGSELGLLDARRPLPGSS